MNQSICHNFIYLTLATSVIWCDFVSAQSSQSSSAASQGTSFSRSTMSDTHFSAREVIWDHQSLTLSALGDVRLRQGKLLLTCAKAKLTFTTENLKQKTSKKDHLSSLDMDHVQLIKVVADGIVKVTFTNLSLSATHVIYDHHSQVLFAQGPIRGTWKSLKLSGQSLEISLAQHHASLRKATMSLPLPSLTPHALPTHLPPSSMTR